MDNGMFGIDVTRHAARPSPEPLEDAPGVERQAVAGRRPGKAAPEPGPIRHEREEPRRGKARAVHERDGITVPETGPERGGLEHE